MNFVAPTSFPDTLGPNALKGVKVLLINMPIREQARPNNPPVGPALLAGRLRAYGAEPNIVDLNIYRIQDAEAARRGLEFGRSLSFSEARALLANAREGARLLVRAPDGFVARGFRDADWRWLIGLCDDDVRANAEQILSEERRRTRAACDAWTQALLDGFRDVCLPCNGG